MVKKGAALGPVQVPVWVAAFQLMRPAIQRSEPLIMVVSVATSVPRRRTSTVALVGPLPWSE